MIMNKSTNQNFCWHVEVRCDMIQVKHDLSSLSESKAASAASHFLIHSGNLNALMIPKTAERFPWI